MIVHLDYETRSRADLTSVGAHRYACDPSTEVFMAGISVHDSDEVFLWVNPKFRTADMLGENDEATLLLRNADYVYAHNAPFEQAITWGTKFEQQIGIHPIQMHQWRCTAAMARKAGLPSSLEKCAEALGLAQQKDPRGKQLIKFFSLPKPDGTYNAPRDFPEEWLAFGEYCRQDVRTEKAIHKALAAFELQGLPLETFQFDLRMNQLGIPVNVPALRNAQRIIDEVQTKVATEFVALTGLNPTQREKVRELVGLPDMQAETVENAIAQTLVDAEAHYRMGQSQDCDRLMRLRRILTLYQQVSYAAVKKIAAMLDWACPDGRMRGVFKYYGAGTGRWSSGGPQLQNAKKATPEMRSRTEPAFRYIARGGTAEGLEEVYGNPLEVIASSIRHFVSGPLLDGDYNAVEARIICWLAGQTDVLEKFQRGEDLYKFMASHVYLIPPERVNKDQREVGKRVFLGAGFQMGASKFQASCREQYQLYLPLDLCERGIEAYRTLCDKVVRYWYYLNNQARAAILAPGKEAGPFVIRKIANLPFLLFKLPSGRSLAYPKPAIEVLPGEERDQITYWGQLPMTVSWGRVKLYGGKLAENCTQGVAADIMACGALEAECRGMPPFALVHDQALASHTDGHTPEEFSAAMATLPDWAKGLPIKVESSVKPFYSK
jgi:DNA polymerase